LHARENPFETGVSNIKTMSGTTRYKGILYNLTKTSAQYDWDRDCVIMSRADGGGSVCSRGGVIIAFKIGGVWYNATESTGEFIPALMLVVLAAASIGSYPIAIFLLVLGLIAAYRR
jgi:hypothetical protein